MGQERYSILLEVPATTMLRLRHIFHTASLWNYQIQAATDFSFLPTRFPPWEESFGQQQACLPKKPPVTTWDLTQRLLLTLTLTALNFPGLHMMRQNNRLKDQLTKKKRSEIKLKYWKVFSRS